MANTNLSPELVELVSKLSETFAQSQQVVAAKARIGLFYQNAEATDTFRKVNEYGEELRNKSMAGMPPAEEEIAKFDALREQVLSNELCTGFLESRQVMDDLLGTVNQYLCLAIDLGHAPSDEDVANAMQAQLQAQAGGGCGCGEGEGDCEGCDGDSCEKGEACCKN